MPFRLSAGYDNATRLWGQIMARCPEMEKSISLCRLAVLRLYRFILVTPTISEIESSNDKKLDEFFQYLSESIDDMLYVVLFAIANSFQGRLTMNIFFYLAVLFTTTRNSTLLRLICKVYYHAEFSCKCIFKFNS